MLTLLIVTGIALAGDLKEVVTPKEKITKRVILLVDTSGSMHTGDRIASAVNQVKIISKQATDDMELAVIAFNEESYRWEGIPEEGITPGWAALPSKAAIEGAQQFIAGISDSSTGTYFEGALRKALSEGRKELSIVLITDGDFAGRDTTESLFGMVNKIQGDRDRAKIGKALIYVIGVAGNVEWLGKLAEDNGGGFYTTE